MPTKLITAPTVEPVTLDQVKASCRIDSAAEDALLAGLAGAARQTAEQITGRSLAPQTWERVLDAFPSGARSPYGGEIELLYPPAATVASVKYLDLDGAEQTLDSGLYLLANDFEPALLLPAQGSAWPQTLPAMPTAVRVRYTAGYADGACPEAIQQWILAHVGHYYRNREATTDKPMQPLPFLDGLLDRYRVWN